jgi:predicted small secreted protein
MNRSDGEAFKLHLYLEGEDSMRKLIILAAAVASLAIAACNTVEGAGKDVSAAGQAVTDTARDAK